MFYIMDQFGAVIGRINAQVGANRVLVANVLDSDGQPCNAKLMRVSASKATARRAATQEEVIEYCQADSGAFVPAWMWARKSPAAQAAERARAAEELLARQDAFHAECMARLEA